MINGADGSSYVLSNTLEIKPNHRYTLALLADKTMTITVDDYEDSNESGVAEMVNQTFGIVAQPANLKNGEFYPMLNVVAVENPALEFNADFTIRSTSEEGIEVAVSGDAGIVENIVVDKKGLITRAPYYSNTFSVKFAAGKFASDKEFRTVVRVTDKASGKTLDIIVWHSDSPVTPPTPPAGGLNAIEDILAVDENGVLNLDGRGKLVFFKWGSVIALQGQQIYAEIFDVSDIAWAPAEFRYAALTTAIAEGTGSVAWTKVPYSTGNEITVDYTKGLGDPCALAAKEGSNVGDYRMPTGLPYEGFTDAGYVTEVDSGYGVHGWKSSTGTPFYPILGHRTSADGSIGGLDCGFFWSSTVFAYLFMQYHLGANPSNQAGKEYGFSIRCVRK